MSDLTGKTTVAVGASRGLGRGIASAFAQAGAPVIVVARISASLRSVSRGDRGATRHTPCASSASPGQSVSRTDDRRARL
jgi:NAD(P)-dependent dehydrogenase (short-subunit alcohol dehydrogenase family)